MEKAKKANLVEIDEAREKLNSLEFFAWLATRAFDTAVTIVHQRERTTAQELIDRRGRLSILLSTWKENPEATECWKKWPYNPSPFGQYQEVDDSAIATAIKFSITVQKVAEIAKLQCDPPFMKLIDASEKSLSQWPAMVRKELESVTLDLEGWSPAKLLRDKQLIVLGIEAELRKVVAGNALDGETELSERESEEDVEKKSGRKKQNSVGKKNTNGPGRPIMEPFWDEQFEVYLEGGPGDWSDPTGFANSAKCPKKRNGGKYKKNTVVTEITNRIKQEERDLIHRS